MFSWQFTCHKCLLYRQTLQGTVYVYSACTYEFVKRHNDNKGRNIMTCNFPDCEICFGSNEALQGLSSIQTSANEACYIFF